MQKRSIVHKQNKNQSGFGIILIILILAAIGTVAAGAAIKVNEAKSKKASEVAQNNANQHAIEAKAAAEKKKAEKKNEPSPTPSTSPVPSVTPTPKPVVTVKPTAVPTAKPVASKATPFTMANCNGTSTVYVSNKNGTTASYNPPGQWSAIKTYAYGAAISVYCQVDGNASGPSSAYAPDYVLANDAFIKSTDLSPTKP